MVKLALLLTSLLLFVAACTSTVEPTVVPTGDSQPDDDTTQTGEVDSPEVINVADATEIKELADGTKYIIHPNQLRGGGPPKDGIPSIDNPKYISVEDANDWIDDDEFGAAIIHKGVKRFYPFQILVWHEIVNDDIAGDPVLITYCPLCGSVIGYKSEINGEAVEFGTSGKLFQSNLVMYDRKTDSYWTQIEGKAVVGPLTGMVLELFPVDVTTWGEWKRAHPDSEVLSRQTGHIRLYGTDPYGGYYESNSLFFPVDEEDNRLHKKAVVFGIVVDGIPKAYPESIVKDKVSFDDTIGSVSITITRDVAGIVTITNTDTNQRIPHERDFWFAWFAFHPDTELYE